MKFIKKLLLIPIIGLPLISISVSIAHATGIPTFDIATYTESAKELELQSEQLANQVKAYQAKEQQIAQELASFKQQVLSYNTYKELEQKAYNWAQYQDTLKEAPTSEWPLNTTMPASLKGYNPQLNTEELAYLKSIGLSDSTNANASESNTILNTEIKTKNTLSQHQARMNSYIEQLEILKQQMDNASTPAQRESLAEQQANLEDTMQAQIEEWNLKNSQNKNNVTLTGDSESKAAINRFFGQN
ncbi:MAG: hypothetical protein R3Y52_01260 [Psittacicella sp.]